MFGIFLDSMDHWWSYEITKKSLIDRGLCLLSILSELNTEVNTPSSFYQGDVIQACMADDERFTSKYNGNKLNFFSSLCVMINSM